MMTIVAMGLITVHGPFVHLYVLKHRDEQMVPGTMAYRVFLVLVPIFEDFRYRYRLVPSSSLLKQRRPFLPNTTLN
ncbi:hypothetical protein HanHA89_Chr10g0384551 [Helianthus annuus]|nr:hypothetical protein HanHA89_Chr10g0384551 [Helianthus annuus]